MASIKVVLFTSKTLKDGTHPIMFRYILNRKTKYVSSGHNYHKKEWDSKNNCPSRKHPNKEELTHLLSKKLTDFRKKVIELQEEERLLSAEEFKQTAKQDKVSKSFFDFVNQQIEGLREDGKIKTAATYYDSQKSFSNYLKGKDLLFREMTPQLMEGYEKYLKKRAVKDGTISVYMRTIRAVFNKAIKTKVAKKTEYPFDEYKIAKFDTTTQKCVISKAKIDELLQLESE